MGSLPFAFALRGVSLLFELVGVAIPGALPGRGVAVRVGGCDAGRFRMVESTASSARALPL